MVVKKRLKALIKMIVFFTEQNPTGQNFQLFWLKNQEVKTN